ncbi:MAG TPA: MarR family transcriptional regulator [Herpetosiphonaceae bacterium]
MEDLSRVNPEQAAIIELVGFRLSTATIMFHTAVADRLGLSVTDVKGYSILGQAGPLTAGELAARMQLTTGAITGLVDRLEAAGLARRARDPQDRRRVVLELAGDPEREREIGGLYAPLGAAVTGLLAGYGPGEQALIGEFLSKVTAIMERETAALRETAP